MLLRVLEFKGKVRLHLHFLVLVCLGLLAQAQTLSPGRPEEVGMSTQRLQRLNGVLEAAIERQEIPGAVVLVARKRKIVFKKAFGYRSLEPVQTPMTIDTIFDVASLTKVMATAPSIMALVEEGKVSLTDSVSEYLPRFANRGKRRITVQQLLTHYSGLRPDLDLDVLWEGYETAVKRAFREQLTAPPGKKFVYSDINYIVLAEIVREVTRQHLHEFAARRIFQPLGMSRTGVLPSEDLWNQIAPTVRRKNKMLQGEVHDPTAFRMGGFSGHAGLFSTVDDTAIFAQMILGHGKYDDVRILSPLSVLKMTTPQTPLGEEELRGAGFDIATRFSSTRGDLFPLGSFGHTGFTGTSLWIDPFTETFVVLFTSRLHPNGKGGVVSLRKKVANVVAAAILELPPLRDRLLRRF